MRAIAVDSQAELEQVVAESARPLLGLALPPGFQLAVAASDSVTVDGYFVHWMDPDRVAQQVSFFEARLSEAAWRTVRIATAGHAVYPTVQAGGQIALYAMHVAFQLLIVGVGVVPYLLVEEKEARTFDALLVSPASFGQVVTGKAVAGALLCLVGGAVVFAFLARWVVHWDVALLAILLGAAFAVGIGLLGGALLDNAQSVGLVMTVLVLILLVVPALGTAVASGLPAWVQSALAYFPTLALSELVRASLAGDLAGAPIARDVMVLAVSAAVVYALVVWRVHQAGR
jgi:ABC-2 type transport system permease protein